MEETTPVMGIIIAPTTEGCEDLMSQHMSKYLSSDWHIEIIQC